MEMVSYKTLRDKIRARIWPSPPGEPRNLRNAHDEHFQDGFHELAKTVQCLQNNNVTVHPACATYVQCAKTVTDAPVGLIKRVSTIANSEWCDQVFYWPTRFTEIEAWARNLMVTFTSPANTDLPALQQGFKFPDSTTDIEFGRARVGQWAQWRNRLYIVPWLQSTEKLVIEWDGVKQTWGDDDQLDLELWDRHVQEAIMAYVRWKHELFFGVDRALQRLLMEDFEKARARAHYECKKRIRQQEEDIALEVTPRAVTLEETEDDEPVTPDSELVFANISDYCDPDDLTPTQENAEMIEGWDVDFIVTNGDNVQGSPGPMTLVDAIFGDYITADLTTNKFWPAIGNHDHTDPPGGIDEYYTLFTLPNNERYYDFVKGPVHVFVLHTALQANDPDNPYEADGIKVTEKQAEWLRVRLALSTAKWKIVVTHESPYTSFHQNYPGRAYLRWPYKTWGADIVLSGDSHSYERFLIDGFPYIVNALGGGGFDSQSDPILSGSLVRYNSDNGCMKCTVNCDELKFEFYTRTGVLVDTLTLTK